MISRQCDVAAQQGLLSDDRRPIEDFLPIQAVSKEASREKSIRKGHISTLQLWWARRPRVACWAAVFRLACGSSRLASGRGPGCKSWRETSP